MLHGGRSIIGFHTDFANFGKVRPYERRMINMNFWSLGCEIWEVLHLKMKLCYPENSRVDFFLPSECVTTWGWHSSTGLELQTLGFTYDKLNRLAEFHPTGVAMYGPWAVPRAVQRADSRRTWSFPVASTPSCHSCILCCSRRDWMSLGVKRADFSLCFFET